MFAHLSLAKYLTFSRCLADALYRHGWRGERGEWQVLYITTIQQLSLKCPIASPRNGSPVAIWEPYNRNKGQLRRQLSWAMCQASLGFVWGVCFVTEFWEGRRCVFKCWHLFRQTGKHSATLLDWNGNSAPPLTAKTMHCVARCFRSFGVPGSSFYVSARAHSRLCFCVNKATGFILGWNTGTMGEVMRKWGNPLSWCHSLAYHVL